MPFYEYRCPRCEAVFEKLLPMSGRDAPGACPTCGAAGAARIVSKPFVNTSATPCGASEPCCAQPGHVPCGGHVHSGGCCCGGH